MSRAGCVECRELWLRGHAEGCLEHREDGRRFVPDDGLGADDGDFLFEVERGGQVDPYEQWEPPW